MSKTDHPGAAFDQGIYNAGSIDIPGGAVVQVVTPGLITLDEREWIQVGRPDGNGKSYLINDHRTIAPGKTGAAAILTRSPWVHVLRDPTKTPATNDEWGPVKDQFYIGPGGSGFFVLGDDMGDAPSAPGSGALPGTKRVRVGALPGTSSPDNIIIGQVQYSVSENNTTFWLINIRVLDGVDPRENPDNPLEPILVENVPAKARTGGDVDPDTVKAKQSTADSKWYPDSTETTPSSIYDGKLKTDLTVAMPSVVVILTRVPDGSPVSPGVEVTAINPPDLLRPGSYEHVGNTNGNCTLTPFASYTLLTVQPPLRRPVAP